VFYADCDLLAYYDVHRTCTVTSVVLSANVISTFLLVSQTELSIACPQMTNTCCWMKENYLIALKHRYLLLDSVVVYLYPKQHVLVVMDQNSHEHYTIYVCPKRCHFRFVNMIRIVYHSVAR